MIHFEIGPARGVARRAFTGESRGRLRSRLLEDFGSSDHASWPTSPEIVSGNHQIAVYWTGIGINPLHGDGVFLMCVGWRKLAQNVSQWPEDGREKNLWWVCVFS